MNATDAIATLGVALLLLAFALQLGGRLSRDGIPYALLNAVGASLACWAAWRIPFLPFVVLEGTWALVGTLALARALRRSAGQAG